MKRITSSYDLVVAGGGMAGVCAAIAAARRGLATCLVHERPVLGGVASSEMRVTVHGAACHHAYGRETGIIGEILALERLRNHEEITENGWTNSILDLAVYDLAVAEPNLTLHLNTPVVEVVMAAGEPAAAQPGTAPGYYERPACAASRRLAALVARTLSAEVEHELRAPLFVDATGDAFLADRAGCAWRMGSEGRAETGEPHAAAQASTDTMGSSIHIRARDIGRDAPFAPPAWAQRYEDARFFYEQGRHPTDPRGGFWWIEIGVPWHTIHDHEAIRHELTRHALGVWDWMKNRDPVMKERCRTWALDFIGQVPGKRESRRVIGRHWLDENQLQARTAFPDEVAYGGWFIDLHTPGGLLAPTSEPHAAEGYAHDSAYAASSFIGPYGIPLRSLMARDVDNLFLAGRCLSATHAALGTLRVMGTTALMGQAVGTAAAIMRARGLDLPALAEDAAGGGAAIQAVQQALLRDGCFLPGHANRDDADLARRAVASASSSALMHGQAPAGAAAVRGPDLAQVHGQILHLAGGRLDTVALCLDNPGGEARLPVRLVRLDQLWDYRRGVPGGAPLVAEAVLAVPGGNDRWVEWRTGLADLPEGVYRLEAGPLAGGLRWRQAGEPQPGHSAQAQISAARMRDLHLGLAVRLEPGQPCYAPANVLSGVTRPQRGTNLWRSDPGQGLPQWIQLDWAAPQAIARVELTFASQLLTEVHREAPFFRAPAIARDYALAVDDGEGWREVARAEGNWERRRVHDLPPGTRARRLRLTVLATNGDPAAALYEMRCY